ncbi:MAG: PAS domain S-box protein [Planctomycetota bacterium]
MPDTSSQTDPDFRERRLALLAEATSIPIGSRPLSATAEVIADQMLSGFGCDAVIMRRVEGERLVLLASCGVPGQQLLRSIPTDAGIAEEILEKRQTVQISNVPEHGLTKVKFQASPNSFRFRSFCGAPMIVGERVVGILSIYDTSNSEAFTARDARDLQIVANHFAAAIANAQLHEELTQLNRELEHRVAERTAALSQSEARFGLLAEHAIDIISQHSPDGRFTYVSPAMTRELGWDPDDVIGKLPREFVHPDDRDAVISARAEMMASGLRAVRREYRFRTRSGMYRWVESASRRITQRTGDQLVVVTRDITDRREAEQRLRLVQAAVTEVQEAVIITDATLDAPGPRILYVNPAFSAMSGYAAHEIEGLTPRVLQGAATDRAMLDRLRATLERGEPFTAETTNYRKDGTPYRVEWNIAPVRQPGGKVTHWVSVQRDVTRRRQTEQLAQLHRDQLAHATRLTTMGELASGLAHELNQPLAAIANYAAGAVNRLDAAATSEASLESAVSIARDALDRVGTQATRAGAIIKRLRSFVNRRATQRHDADINELIREVLALNQADERTGQIEIELNLAEELPACRLDVIQIEQVILNLLRNAMDAVEQQPVDRRRIALSTSQFEDTSDQEVASWIGLEIADSGEGLDDEQLLQLFDPFFTTKPEGMGLGITISQSIVEAHGGRMSARPNEQGGLTVSIRLPVLAGPPHEIRKKSSQHGDTP